MTSLDLPRSIEEVTASWVGGVLCPQDPTSVAAIAVERIGAGSGFMSDLARVTVTSEQANVPDSVIVKLPSSSTANRAVAQAFDSYRNESAFYRRYAAAVPLRVPRVYLNELGDDGFVLVLEDVSTLRRVDQVTGAGRVETMLVMRRLGEMHARFWGSPLTGLARYEHALEQVAAHFPSVLPAVFEASSRVPDAVRDWMIRFADDFLRHSRTHLAREQTLVHVDFRLDNLFFVEDDAGGVIDLVAIDWGDSCRGPGTFDVAHFLATCVGTADRRRYERVAVETYHAALGAEIGAVYTLEACWLDYRRFLPGVAYIPALIAALAPENPRGREVRRVMADRSLTAIADHLEAIVGAYAAA